jgi:hypothetical protein
MGIAQTQSSQTPKAISKEYAWVVLDPGRDQDRARFLGQYALAIPIHYYLLSSVAHHSRKFNRGSGQKLTRQPWQNVR